METSDIIIVGAGISGLMAALFLRREGVATRILVVDGLGVGQAQTRVQPGGVRQQWSTEMNCRLARFGHRFYRQAAEELDEPRIHLAESGYLFLAHGAAEHREMAAATAIQHGLGIGTELLDAPEIWRRFPYLRPADDVTGAAFLQQDGYFDDPRLVVHSVARAAERLGVQIRTERVEAVLAEHGRVRGVRTERESYGAGTVILAAGAGTRALAAQLGVDLPISVEPKYLLFSDPLRSRMFDPLIISARDGVAVKQLASGGLLASYLSGTDPAAAEDWRAKIRSFGQRLLPSITDVALPRLVEGFYDSTPDHQGIVSAAGPEGLFIAAGMSGHGFMIAPAVAQTLVALLGGREVTDWPVRDLALGRFARGAGAEGEQRVI